MHLYGALVDTATGAVLHLGTYEDALVELANETPDAFFQGAINIPNYTGFWQSIPLRLLLRADSPTKWTWELGTRKFLPTKKSLLTDDLASRSKLAAAKYALLTEIMVGLRYVRQNIYGSAPYQDAVYLGKRLQAQQFKDLVYPEGRIIEFPYILQYADHANISFQQAADDILFKAKLTDELLSKTEAIRLRYFQKVREAVLLDQLPSLREEFLRESYINARV